MAVYYEDSCCTIYHANCFDMICQLPVCKVLLTDPPYCDDTHKNAKSNRGSGHDVKAINFESISHKYLDFFLLLTAPHVETWGIMFAAYDHIVKLKDAPHGWEFVRFGVWLKSNPMPQISADRPAHGWDGIAYMHRDGVKKQWNGGGKHGNFYAPVVSDGLHPTGKPLSILTQLVQNFTKPGDLILDPFMGSGTTLRAAKDMGRKAIGIEINEKYCEIAARRLSQEVLLFG